MKTVHRTVGALAGATLLVGFGLVISFWAFQQIEEAAAARKHTNLVIGRAGELLTAMVEAETGQRGYALTGDEVFLEPYLAVRGGVGHQVAELRELTAIGPARERLDAVAPLIDAKLAGLARIIALRRNQDVPAVLAAISGGEGKQLMDSIRAGLKDYIRIESERRAQHEERFEQNMSRLFVLIVIASLGAVVLAGAFAYLLRREAGQRLKQGILAETQHLLGLQRQSNEQLLQANVSLALSEGKLAVTLQSIGDGVIATDARGEVTFLNPIAEKLSGWALAEARGRPADEVFRIISQATRESIACPVRKTLAEGTPQGLANHTLLIARDGTECAIADSCAPIRDRTGLVIGAVLVFRDVTKEYAAQQAVSDSAARTQAILNTVADGIITLRAGGGIVETVNPAAERMFGYSAAELIGQDSRVLVPQFATDHGNGFLAPTRDTAQTVAPEREVTGRRKDGGSFPLEIAVTEMWLAGQRHLTVLLRDVTARNLLDQQLRDQQFYTRSLIESNIDALITTDPSGLITDVNRQMELLTGCTRLELIGAPFTSCFTEPERAGAAIAQVLGAMRVSNFELTARDRDGRTTVVSLNAATFHDRERRLQGVFAAARDITERKTAEEVLRSTLEELHRANAGLAQTSQLKDEFLANMSHELRTPLNAVLGLSETLLEQVSGPLTPRQVKSITTISTSGQHLLTLINDILDLSKIEAGKLDLNLATVNTDEFCQSCLAFVKTQALKKQIGVEFELDGRIKTFPADPKRFKQVLVNLLTNAVKFTPEGGRIGLAVTGGADQEVVCFTVWDTGIGIAPEDVTKLFTSFSQIDSGLNRTQQGTGLGLALVARLAELHGGSVALVSAPGKGSRFTVSLPWVVASVPPPVAVPVLASKEYRRALVIEDDPTAGAILMDYLAGLGLECVLHTHGVGAVAAVLRVKPDVILLDIQLPGESGWVVLARLKEDPETRNIPVVVITVVDEPGKSRALGAVAHFTKPVTRAQLARLFQSGAAAARPVLGGAGPAPKLSPLILLAEDNEANAETLGGYLEDKGYTLRYARNGREAVDLARQLRPALILMDIQMPVMDGLAAIRLIRAEPPGKAIPIVALTALAMPGDRERCLAAGATDYMSKPVGLKSLAALVENLVGKGEAQPGHPV